MKTNILRVITLILTFLTTIELSGQSAYIRIVDDNFIPTVKNVEKKIQIETYNKEFQNLLSRYEILKFEKGFPCTNLDWFKNVYYIEMKDDVELIDFLNVLLKQYNKQIPYIDKIEEAIYDADSFLPNDSLYVAGVLSHLDLVRAPEAWNIAKHYGKVKIGIIDHYFHEQHPDLIFDTIIGPNVYETNYYWDHGTVVSGFINGTTNNNIGIASVGGLNTELWASNINSMTIFRFLAMSGCKVINCSWHNSYTYNDDLALFYDSILNNYDCLVVASAGNDTEHGGGSLSCKVYPASYPSCLSVTSVGHKYDYGDNGNHNWKDVHCLVVNDTTTSHHHNTAVDVCAPGYEVISTNYWHNVAGYNSGKSGTSYAAPIVTGIAAMVRTVNPNLTAAQTMQIIKETADASIYDIPENAPFIGRLGTGRVDAYAAVRKACAVDVENETYTADETLEGCIVTLKDVKVQNSSRLIIDAVVEAELISNVEIPLGSSFEIR